MESVYKHLIKTDGPDAAKRTVYTLFCHIKLGQKRVFKKEFVDDIIESIVDVSVRGITSKRLEAYKSVIDVLVDYTMSEYTFEQFISEVKEEEFDNIILDFEKWDRINPEEVLYNLRKRSE